MEKQVRLIIASLISLIAIIGFVFAFKIDMQYSAGLICLTFIVAGFLGAMWKTILFDTSIEQLEFKTLFQKYFGNIELFVLVLFLLALPLIYVRTLNDGALRSRLYALSVLVLFFSAMFTWRFFKGDYKIYLTKVDYYIFGALGLFLLLNVASALQGVANGKEALVQVLKEFTLAFVFFYFYQILRNVKMGKNLVIKAFILMTLIFIAIGIQQLLQADFTQFRQASNYYGYYLRQAVGHVISTLSSINPFTSFLYLSLAFSTYGIIKFKWFWKIVAILSMLGAMFFIILLASKAAWGALAIFAVVAIVLLYYYLLVIRPKEQGKLLPMVVHVGLLLLPFLGITAGVYLVDKSDSKVLNVVIDKIQQVLNPELCLNNIYSSDKPTSTQTRTLVWANTLEMTRDHPILGVGPGQWRIQYAKYGLDGFEFKIRNGTKHFQRTHNDFFWIMGETGFTGLFLYAFLYIGILVVAFRSYRQKSDFKNRLVQGILFAVLLGFILILFVSFPRERITHNITYLFLFSLVLLGVQKTNTTLDKNITWLKIAIPATVLLFMFNVYVSNNLFNAEKEAKIIYRNTIKKRFPLVLRSVDKIIDSYFTLDNYSTPIYYYKGVAESSLKHSMKLAQKNFIKAHELNPFHLQVLNNLATSYDLLGDKQTALKIYDQALAISPRYVEALVNKSIVLYNLKKYDEAFEIIKSIAINKNNPPKYKETAITMCRKRAALLVDKLDVKKVDVWFKNEEAVYKSFVSVKQDNIKFDDYLIKEFGK